MMKDDNTLLIIAWLNGISEMVSRQLLKSDNCELMKLQLDFDLNLYGIILGTGSLLSPRLQRKLKKSKKVTSQATIKDGKQFSSVISLSLVFTFLTTN